MRDLFIADAHLLDPGDANYRLLLKFLRAQRGRTRTLVLLGDIFEFWIGYRSCVFSAYVPLLETLRELRLAGTRIVYVEGNHDFHLGPYFAETLGCEILPDGGVIELDGWKIHVSHGDLIDPADRGYRLLRRFLRSPFLRLLAAILPPDWAWAIARWAGNLSRRSHSPSPRREAPMHLLEEHARRRFASGCQAVVTGHFHAPARRDFDGRVLIALGDWIDQYSYAVFAEGEFSLTEFSSEL
jgi:UDP-2,3-diacylglucosamine hydrolase